MLCNSEGVIDYDYVDPTYIMVGNFSSQGVTIYNGDRIAQGELIEIKQVAMEEISEPPQQKTDRNGGFGSTGV
jgi:dUTPase